MNMLQNGTVRDAGVSAVHVDRVRAACADWVKKAMTPALIVLAARHGVIFLHEAWGRLGPEKDSPPAGSDTIFGLASISKPVTATAVMTLVETNQIGLHSPIQVFLPEFHGPGCEEITVWHLLTHTSGLPNRSGGGPLEAGQAGLEHKPGTWMAYSNAGYDLLGELVQRVSDSPLDAYIRRSIFEPLGMKDSTMIHARGAVERTIRRMPGTAFDWPVEMEGTCCGSSSLWGTALDLAIFLQTFLNQGGYGKTRLLRPETVTAMTQNQVKGIPRELVNGVPNQPRGLGWFLLEGMRFPNSPTLLSKLSYGHAGASGAFAWVDPACDLIGVFLFAKTHPDSYPLGRFVDSVMRSILR
jgi:CubicO group peptidase (beta-lactamase class C family)